VRRHAASGKLRAQLLQNGRGRPSWHIHREELPNARISATSAPQAATSAPQAATSAPQAAISQPTASDPVLAGQLAALEKSVSEIRGFLAGQLATEQNLEARIAKGVQDAIKPLLIELDAKTRENEELKKQIDLKVRPNSGVLSRLFGR
jgi:hypothetical protein